MQVHDELETFVIYVNELAFFYEPWLYRSQDGGTWPANPEKIPPDVLSAFLETIKKRGRIHNPHEARLLIDTAIWAVKKLPPSC